MVLKAIQTGFIGGFVAVLASLIGMIESFHARDIIAGKISMGKMTLLLIVVMVSFFSSRGEGIPVSRRITSGILTGFFTSALLAGLVLLGRAVNLREVLVNASPPLYKILTFEREVNTGVGLLLGSGILIGLVVSLSDLRECVTGETLVLLADGRRVPIRDLEGYDT